MSEVVGPVLIGRLLVKWEKRVEEYITERGRRGLDQARRECWNRENLCGHPLGVNKVNEG